MSNPDMGLFFLWVESDDFLKLCDFLRLFQSRERDSISWKTVPWNWDRVGILKPLFVNLIFSLVSAFMITQEIDGKLGSRVSSERGGKVTRRIYPHSINGDADLQYISEWSLH